MSLLKSLATEAASGSLQNTSWSFTYSGATGSLNFGVSGNVQVVYPNGQTFNVKYYESGNDFWINMTGFSGWFELFQGTISGNSGGGTMVEGNESTGATYTYAFTMAKK